MSYRGPFVSELPDRPVVECVWASGLNCALAVGATTTATGAEREALRVAGGGSDLTGANLTQLATAMHARYGLASRHTTGSAAAIGTALAAGSWLVVRGEYGALPAAYRHQANTAFSHAVAVGPGPWLVDPLETAPVHGQAIDLPTVVAFAASNGYDILSVGGNEPMTLTVTDPTPRIVSIPAGRQLYGLDGTTPIVKVSSVNGALSPFATGAFRAIIVLTGGVRELLLAHTSDCTLSPVPTPKPAAPAPVTIGLRPDGTLGIVS